MNRKTRNTLKAHPAVTDICRNEIEVYVPGDDGRADYDATEAAATEVLSILPSGWGGYRAGNGAWVLSKGYAADAADYCDRASRTHY